MFRRATAVLLSPLAHGRQASFWRGLLLAGSIAALGLWLAELPRLRGWGLSALTLAIVLGMLAGNSFFPAIAKSTAAGVDFSRSRLLRLGIILYGFRITFQQIGEVGVAGLIIDAAMVASVFALAVTLGPRWLGVDRQTAMLIGAGSAICGAAAVMATEPVVRAPAHKVSVAVATVVVFGTVAMFLYPWLYPYLGMDAHAYGVYAGSTIHEVAQVIVAGNAVDQTAAASAVIEKMLRVMLLAPFLLLLGWALRRGRGRVAATGTPLAVPWFALGFIAVCGFNSLQLLPASWVEGIVRIDTALLAMAMAALGLRTHAGAIRQAGIRPLLLAAALFLFLLTGGWAVNVAVARWFQLAF
ncbi:YeiH family protein [Pseudoxanthomonas wuyuanensis]|uniref:Conserved hypothetical integral membrane protein n=1 Tax=Pseudoxanthomonas wuyuanensis TaxID=1073196 RepID=A0A286CY44_9GAMM|nr:YeiH family protein [Pseudoxanthomonas wuyuanensis]KAF1722681.1 YeiH family putative sulfate export transporter [Pseudoxanthomonas wuyuanensis]SOD51311.1 conserved hypothetical integral membrane protein [Pseudoxanthomonas wuyuanensis]